jgi:hypothetical protein
VIADGNYDVFIVDATPLTETEEPIEPSVRWRLDLTILAGEHKGEVVTINATGLDGSEFDLIGMPGTLVVADGRPAFTIDG